MKKNLFSITVFIIILCFTSKAQNVLYIAGQTSFDEADSLVYDSLVAWGYNVTWKTGNEAVLNNNLTDTIGQDVILQTNQGWNHLDLFKKNFTLPFILTQFPDQNGLCASQLYSADFSSSEVYIPDNNHPVLAGIDTGVVDWLPNKSRRLPVLEGPGTESDQFIYMNNSSKTNHRDTDYPMLLVYNEGDSLPLNMSGGDFSWASETATALRIKIPYEKTLLQPSQASVNKFYPDLICKLIRNALKFAIPNTFTGNTDNTWNNSDNWYLDIPDTVQRVIIPEGKTLSIATDARCYNMQIDSGSVVNIGTSNSLTVDNDLVLKTPLSNGATGQIIDMGSLTVNGNFTIERYLPANSTMNNWRYISMPVDGIQASNLEISKTGNYLFAWHEPADSWHEITTDATNLLTTSGFAYGFTSDTTIRFTGMPNTGDYNVAGLTYTSGGTYAGYHLLGNPYPSAIDADNLNITNLSDDIWYRTDGTFQTYNLTTGTGVNGGTNIIPAMQSFWVSVISGTTGSLTFTNNARVSNATTLFKSSDIEGSLARLVISGNGFEDEMAVGFYNGAKEVYDIFDSRKMFAISEKYPQLYTIVDGEKLAINNYPAVSSRVIPLGIKANETGNYKIELTNLKGFNMNTRFLLRDIDSHELKELHEGTSYNFRVTNTGEINDRFSLEIVTSDEAVTGIISSGEANNLDVYSSDGHLYIKTSIPVNGSTNVEVFNMQGQRIYKNELHGLSGTRKLDIERIPGCMIIKISSPDNIIIKKLIQ